MLLLAYTVIVAGLFDIRRRERVDIEYVVVRHDRDRAGFVDSNAVASVRRLPVEHGAFVLAARQIGGIREDLGEVAPFVVAVRESRDVDDTADLVVDSIPLAGEESNADVEPYSCGTRFPDLIGPLGTDATLRIEQHACGGAGSVRRALPLHRKPEVARRPE